MLTKSQYISAFSFHRLHGHYTVNYKKNQLAINKNMNLNVINTQALANLTDYKFLIIFGIFSFSLISIYKHKISLK